jgi:hypothetical protein
MLREKRQSSAPAAPGHSPSGLVQLAPLAARGHFLPERINAQRLESLVCVRASLMKRILPNRIPMRPDGCTMTEDDFRKLHDQLADFDKVEWIEEGTREIVERFMPDLVDRLPERQTETFDKAFGKIRAAGARKVPSRSSPPAKPQR